MGLVNAGQPRGAASNVGWTPAPAIGSVGWFGLEMSARYSYGFHPDNRFKVYEVRRSIAPGMTSAELERLLVSADSNGLKHAWNRERTEVSVWAKLGLLRTCYLMVELRDGRVVHASVRGEDGENDRFIDAPPDF